MAKKEQYYNFSLSTYCEEDFVLKVLDLHSNQIKAFAYCVHDCDVNDNGEIKEKHIHVLLLLNYPYPPATVCNWFSNTDSEGKKINTLWEKLVYPSLMYRYLIHEDNPEKYQYDPSLRICSELKYFLDETSTDDVAQLALFDLLDGVSLREVARRYGRDFIYHYGHIKQIYEDIKLEEGIKND